MLRLMVMWMLDLLCFVPLCLALPSIYQVRLCLVLVLSCEHASLQDSQFDIGYPFTLWMWCDPLVKRDWYMQVCGMRGGAEGRCTIRYFPKAAMPARGVVPYHSTVRCGAVRWKARQGKAVR